jgi:hypothetical protein
VPIITILTILIKVQLLVLDVSNLYRGGARFKKFLGFLFASSCIIPTIADTTPTLRRADQRAGL